MALYPAHLQNAIEGPCVVGANCRIGRDAVVRESVLWDYTRAGAGSFIDERIVIAGRFVEPNGDSIDLAEADMGWLLGDARAAAPDSPHADALRRALSAPPLLG